MSEKQDPLQPLRDVHPGGHLLDHHGGHADHPDRPELQLQPRVLLVCLSHLLPIFPFGNFLLDVCGRLASLYQLINYLISPHTLTDRALPLPPSYCHLLGGRLQNEVSSLLSGWLG